MCSYRAKKDVFKRILCNILSLTEVLNPLTEVFNPPGLSAEVGVKGINLI